MPKPRVLLLTQWFEPEPVFKGLLFARELVREGFDVEVVTGFPNYPGGKIYPGYAISLLRREVMDGIPVARVALFPSHGRSVIGRMANYISFAITSAWYAVFVAKRADVIYVYQLPTKGLVSLLVRFFRGSAVVLDVEDIWPDTLRATGMIREGFPLKLAGWLAGWVYRRADALVVISEGFRDLLIQRGVRPERVEVVLNWCDEDALRAGDTTPQPEWRDHEHFQIVFAGNLGPAQALDAVLEAATLLQAQHSNVQFVFVGEGLDRDRLAALAAERRLTNVRFLPRVPMSEVGRVLRAADALLVHLRADELFAITIPSKTQAYMAIGKPILMAAPGIAAKLVLRADCGVTASPENPASIAAAAAELSSLSASRLRTMGEQGRRFYERNMSMRTGVAKIGAVMRRAIEQRSRALADQRA